MKDNPETTGYALVVSFEDQSPSYCYGFEAGCIWQRMQDGDEQEIEVTVSSENRETIRRMGLAKGWDADFQPTGDPTWLFLKLTKTKAELARPNPRGLHVIQGGLTDKGEA